MIRGKRRKMRFRNNRFERMWIFWRWFQTPRRDLRIAARIAAETNR